MEDLSLHILDIVENSVAAGATTVEITVEEDTGKDLLGLEIKDNGKGIDNDMIEAVTDPFFTTKTVRRVGLGLPLLKQAAEGCEGTFSLRSDKGKGTTVSVGLRRSHIDRKPLGDMAATMIVLIAGNPETDFVFSYRKDELSYRLDTREIREELAGIPITSPEVLRIIREDMERGLSKEAAG
ncbi:MAG: ATP-binding protein [Nitrospirae bacterium]|nr:ATP-binding protein [Nitrospirota bacterium]